MQHSQWPCWVQDRAWYQAYHISRPQGAPFTLCNVAALPGSSVSEQETWNASMNSRGFGSRFWGLNRECLITPSHRAIRRGKGSVRLGLPEHNYQVLSHGPVRRRERIPVTGRLVRSVPRTFLKLENNLYLCAAWKRELVLYCVWRQRGIR